MYAAEYYGDFQYEDNGENASIYAYNGSDKEVTIPAYINDKAVTEINDYAFLLCNSVEKIIVPSTVTTIHANAFSGAGNLKNVVLASSDTKIEDSNENTEKIQMKTESRIRPMPQTIRMAIIQKIKMPETLISLAHQIIRLRNSP